MMTNILIIDDEIEMLNSLEKILSRRKDFKLTLLENSIDAIELIDNKHFDLVITDLKMKNNSGIDILEKVKAKNSKTPVIIISGYGTIAASVEALKKGVFDFIEKPFTSNKLFKVINEALIGSAYDNKEIEKAEDTYYEEFGIIYKSKKMADLIKTIKKISKGNLNILITGESGTGKELIARAIHTLSKGNNMPFVPVNCGALPEHLFESEVFGHEKGAFTGAFNSKPGLIEFANHGTFFLDEIGELSKHLQIKLLRMLEEKKIRRIGSTKEIKIDVQIIAATNKILEQEIKENRFREDLYYRLTTLHIDVPPLRERKEDILPIATNYLSKICNSSEKSQIRFSQEAKNLLTNYSWPGNVRELQNLISRSFYICSNQFIKKSDLPIHLVQNNDLNKQKYFDSPYKEAKQKVIEKFELQYLSYHLKTNKGNISKTAEACGLDRRTIHRLIKKYNVFYTDK